MRFLQIIFLLLLLPKLACAQVALASGSKGSMPLNFIAVAYNGTNAACSADGVHWNLSAIPKAGWSASAQGNGIIIVVAYNSASVISSCDKGNHWTLSTMPVSAKWDAVAYWNGYFVAIASQSTNAAYSNDGVNWTLSTLPVVDNWIGIAGGSGYGKSGVFNAVAYVSGNSAYSTNNGATWILTALPENSNWYANHYGRDQKKFVAVTYSGDSIMANSTYGTNWVAQVNSSEDNWSCLAEGNGNFLTVAFGDTYAMYSPDTTNWTTVTIPSAYNWSANSFKDGKFLIIASGSSNALLTTDCITYTPTALPYDDNWDGLSP